jgi:hypothetical protein
LLSPLFLLSVDKGRLSITGLIRGPCMIEETEGALWPIYGTCLGGQYWIDLPLLLTVGGSIVSCWKRKGGKRGYNKSEYSQAMHEVNR